MSVGEVKSGSWSPSCPLSVPVTVPVTPVSVLVSAWGGVHRVGVVSLGLVYLGGFEEVGHEVLKTVTKLKTINDQCFMVKTCPVDPLILWSWALFCCSVGSVPPDLLAVSAPPVSWLLWPVTWWSPPHAAAESLSLVEAKAAAASCCCCCFSKCLMRPCSFVVRDSLTFSLSLRSEDS